MAAFFHCTVSGQGLGSSEEGRGHPASLRVGGSGLPGAAAGLLGCHVKESSCELTSPGGAVGPAWHLESVLQMSRMRSDSRLDAKRVCPGHCSGGCPRVHRGATPHGDCLSLEPCTIFHPSGPRPPSLGDGRDLTVSLPLENLEEDITTEIQGTPVLGRFWDSHFTDAHTGEGTYPRLRT